MAIKGFITMSQQEVLRLQVIEKLKNRVLSQSEASKIVAEQHLVINDKGKLWHLK